MCINTGTLKPTPIPELLVAAIIQPPNIRRGTVHTAGAGGGFARANNDRPINQDLDIAPRHRFRPRFPRAIAPLSPSENRTQIRRNAGDQSGTHADSCAPPLCPAPRTMGHRLAKGYETNCNGLG
ncbi:unnamed protein product [Lampetra planeri]